MTALRARVGGVRELLLPPVQRRTIAELTGELDLRSGDVRSKQTAFWTMLVLSAVIASAGVLTDSTATVIGAMIIAPLSTPIMGIALAIAKRERNGATFFVAAGAVLVISVGVCFSFLLPVGYDLLSNSQIASRVSPGLVDMIAALATGLAGAVALARRDVGAVLPGVAIAISLVPPLAVVGICLGRTEWFLALGALLLFGSNLLALVLAGTLVFTFVGYAEVATVAHGRSRRRAYTTLSVMLILVILPLAANAVVTYVVTSYGDEVGDAARNWVTQVPGASVTGVQNHGLTITVSVLTPQALPPAAVLREDIKGRIPDVIGVQVRSEQGEQIVVRPSGGSGS
jgi:uncharacterized hydrophobic protein (TIGR00271 family)